MNFYTIGSQKIIRDYQEIFDLDEFILNRKISIRRVAEAIIEELYSRNNVDEILANKNTKITARKAEIENLHISKKDKDEMIKAERLYIQKPKYLSNKVNILIESNLLPKKFQAAFSFIQSEGSHEGGHIDVSSVSLGEESYLEAMIICVNPIMRWFLGNIGMPTKDIDALIVEKSSDYLKLVIKNSRRTMLLLVICFMIFYVTKQDYVNSSSQVKSVKTNNYTDSLNSIGIKNLNTGNGDQFNNESGTITVNKK